jgi:hypothetical protein
MIAPDARSIAAAPPRIGAVSAPPMSGPTEAAGEVFG